MLWLFPIRSGKGNGCRRKELDSFLFFVFLIICFSTGTHSLFSLPVRMFDVCSKRITGATRIDTIIYRGGWTIVAS